MASGKSLGSCCAYDHKRGCSNKSNDFEACSWRSDTRIAWLHVPKTGTSFLLALALMANRSLATHIESGKMMREMMYNAGVQWQGLFQAFPFAKYFRGSSIWWLAGVQHAGISRGNFEEYRGRFFALFRDPRARGWSAYNEFVGDAATRQLFPPNQYAKCIAGAQVKMLTGEVGPLAYSSLRCHCPVINGTAPFRTVSCARGCGATVPEALAKLLMSFAFVGLAEEYAVSICLFAAKFRAMPVGVFANSTHGKRGSHAFVHHHRVDLNDEEYNASSDSFSVFADPYGMALHGWAQRGSGRTRAAALSSESARRESARVPPNILLES